jgi:hypothetical protein
VQSSDALGTSVGDKICTDLRENAQSEGTCHMLVNLSPGERRSLELLRKDGFLLSLPTAEINLTACFSFCKVTGSSKSPTLNHCQFLYTNPPSGVGRGRIQTGRSHLCDAHLEGLSSTL